MKVTRTVPNKLRLIARAVVKNFFLDVCISENTAEFPDFTIEMWSAESILMYTTDQGLEKAKTVGKWIEDRGYGSVEVVIE